MTELEKRIALGEGYHLELKESVDKSFIEEACAFANSSGGTIVLGVSDKGDVIGIDTGNTMRSRIQDTLRQIEPSLEMTLSVEGDLLVVDVPSGPDKPYGCSKGFFMRIGANSQKLTRNEIVSFFQKEGRVRFDELENRKADFATDFDGAAWARYVELAGMTSGLERDLMLRNLDCLTEEGRLTNAGVLFFATSVEFLLMQATVVCVLYKGTEKLHILDKKDFAGNLIENVENAVLFVQRHTNTAYRIEHLRREEIPAVPEVALRESIINAVCHRDYFHKGANVMVEVFGDRVEISNPGGLPSDLSPEEFGTRSVARNPVVASLLQRADYIERIGTGINRIRDAVAESDACAVDFTFSDFFSVTFSFAANGGLNGRLKNEVSEETEGAGRLNGRLNGRLKDQVGGLNPALKELFGYIAENPGCRINDMAEALSRPIDTLNKQMRQLVSKQLVEHRGSRKTGGYWTVEHE